MILRILWSIFLGCWISSSVAIAQSTDGPVLDEVAQVNGQSIDLSTELSEKSLYRLVVPREYYTASLERDRKFGTYDFQLHSVPKELTVEGITDAGYRIQLALTACTVLIYDHKCACPEVDPAQDGTKETGSRKDDHHCLEEVSFQTADALVTSLTTPEVHIKHFLDSTGNHVATVKFGTSLEYTLEDAITRVIEAHPPIGVIGQTFLLTATPRVVGPGVNESVDDKILIFVDTYQIPPAKR